MINLKGMVGSKEAGFLIFLGMILLLMTASKNQSASLGKNEAIATAEEFIRDNGYTDLPPKTSKLRNELFDDLEPKDSVLKYRRNTLQPKAFCISENKTEWHVGFLSSGVNLATLDSSLLDSDLHGRAVIVEKNTHEIRMAHKTPLFSHFERLKNE